MDEIISSYKQYWPVLDLVAIRDIPEEEDDDDDKTNDNEGGDGSKNSGGAAASGGDKDKVDSGDKGKDKKDKDKKDDKDKSKNVDTYVKKKAEDKSEDKKDKEANGEGGKGGGKTDGKNKTGDGGGTVEEDENLVDLFLDLSVADAAGGWSIYGSTESLPQPESIMPAYFNTDQFYVETDNHVHWRDSDRTYVV